eukprot:364806-Chlamydomonas_euryale.AAC.3
MASGGTEGLPGETEGLSGGTEGLPGETEGLSGETEGLPGGTEGLPNVSGMGQLLASGETEGLPGGTEGLPNQQHSHMDCTHSETHKHHEAGVPTAPTEPRLRSSREIAHTWGSYESG